MVLCREPPSPPETLVPPALIGGRARNRLIGLPGPGDVAQISPLSPAAGHTGALCQRNDGCFVQARAGRARARAQRGIDGFRNTTDGILHALIIGIACIVGKQIRAPDRAQGAHEHEAKSTRSAAGSTRTRMRPRASTPPPFRAVK